MSDPKQIPPSLEDVSAFLTMLGSDLNPEDFIDFYESKEWKVGRDRMKNWHAAARLASRTWRRGYKTVTDDRPMTEWERKQKQDRMRDLIERKRAITNPGGSAFSVSLDATKLGIVRGLEAKIAELKKELNE